MERLCRIPGLLLVGPMLWAAARDVYAQVQAIGVLPGVQSSSRFELSETVQLDRAEGTTLAHLQRVKAYLADGQWDEAVETLCALMEHSEDKLIGVTDHRFVTLRDYGHLRLAALPAEALALYRSRIDPVAQRWYQEGLATRDRRLLAKVVDQAFASSFGDDALMAIGELALESGDHAAARWCWQRIVPAELPPETPLTWPGYPDTDLDLAAVRARLVLVSILEGSRTRARDELEQFTRLHGDARGRLGGREADYCEALRTMRAESADWPRPPSSPDWPTFAGSPARNKIASETVDVGQLAWRAPLPEIRVAESPLPIGPSKPEYRPALSYHPVFSAGLVLVNTRREILTLDAQTGQPAWQGAAAAIYRAELEGAAGDPSDPLHTLGAPRCTMTVFDGKVYARMGTALTGGPQDSAFSIRPGYLVCLDLAAEGRLMWKFVPEDGWALEGSPLSDGASVYVAMRRNDVRPQAHVACFDAQTGRPRWRRFVCGAETPARGTLFQTTHNLLTLCGETIYYNTNLGAVAALAAEDGRLKWLSLYPRARQGDLMQLAPHWHRDLNPCLYDHGTLLVAPADSPRLFALDAATGQILWQTGPEVTDVVHLLGATEEHLIAAGGRLYWVGLNGESAGRVKHRWPDGAEQPGHGRGVLAGDTVLFPTREKVYMFDVQTARPRKVLDLVPLGATGGNLLIAGGQLVIATENELIALGRHGGPLEKGANPTAMLEVAPR
ncbi:MAG: PQQ-like beta-propeller repeat protein [Pirellulales bacterium]|nr:PQQ-like beta-propeller repeat protein [Pirellulales bacterium]